MSEVITGDACPCCGDIALPRWCSVSRPNEQAPYGLESETRFYYECRKCGLRTKDYQTRKAALEAWNTRAERTCVLEDIPYEPGCWEGVRCSSCGVTDEDADLTGNYCPNCGAKVERGES